MKFKKLFLLMILVLSCNNNNCYSQEAKVCENFNYPITNMYLHAKKGKVISFVLPSGVNLSPYAVVCALLTHLNSNRNFIPKRAVIVVATAGLKKFNILNYSRDGDWIAIFSGEFKNNSNTATTVWIKLPNMFDRIEEIIMGRSFPLSLKNKTKATQGVIRKSELLTLMAGVNK